MNAFITALLAALLWQVSLCQPGTTSCRCPGTPSDQCDTLIFEDVFCEDPKPTPPTPPAPAPPPCVCPAPASGGGDMRILRAIRESLRCILMEIKKHVCLCFDSLPNDLALTIRTNYGEVSAKVESIMMKLEQDILRRLTDMAKTLGEGIQAAFTLFNDGVAKAIATSVKGQQSYIASRLATLQALPDADIVAFIRSAAPQQELNAIIGDANARLSETISKLTTELLEKIRTVISDAVGAVSLWCESAFKRARKQLKSALSCAQENLVKIVTSSVNDALKRVICAITDIINHQAQMLTQIVRGSIESMAGSGGGRQPSYTAIPCYTAETRSTLPMLA